MNYENLTWNDKIALINEFRPSIEQIVACFRNTPEEIKSAMLLYRKSMLQPSNAVSKYGNIFDSDTRKKSSEINTNGNTPKKRGRKGNKIITALLAVPSQPVTVKCFMEKYNVSLSVLRQHRRFVEKMTDEQKKLAGDIVVKQDKKTKELMIWKR